MPPEDDVLPVEEQLLPAAVSPTADSPGYVPESDPEEDLEEDDDEDSEEDPADYPVDGGDDDDDEDESSDDDKDDDVNIEGDEEEEEHPTLADSTAVALPVVDHALSAEETESFDTDESAVARLLARPSPPPSPLSSWSSPLHQIPSPPLPVSPSLLVSPPLPLAPPPLHVSPTYPLGYRAAMIRLGAEAPSTSHSPPPHIILSHNRSYTPPLGELWFFATMDREIMRDLERDVGYRITDTWDEMLDTNEIYTRVWMVSDERQLMVVEVMSLRTTVLGQQAVITELQASDRRRQAAITELQAADRRRQAAITELLAADRRRQAQFFEALKLLKRLQTRWTELEIDDQDVTSALAASDANRSTNGDDSHVYWEKVLKVEDLLRVHLPRLHEVPTSEFQRHGRSYRIDSMGMLTWWNSHVRTVGHDVAVEIKKLEAELWNLKVKGIDVIGYNQCFQELALLCVRMFPEESDKIKRYVGGLPHMIYGSVVASNSKSLQRQLIIASE
ncbi:hypothetical protein Tco_1533198 [Tanacetum coccineum]